MAATIFIGVSLTGAPLPAAALLSIARFAFLTVPASRPNLISPWPDYYANHVK
mgnify:CR=1 FL=1